MTRIDPAALRRALEYYTHSSAFTGDKIALIFAAARAYLDQEAWQPIETAPKGDVIRYEPAEYRKNERHPYLDARIVISNGAYPRKATHWMPLPAPPKAT
jgi:hypothetical protein